MHCPRCGSKFHKIKQTWQYDESIQRIRECKDCFFRWGTVEINKNEIYEKKNASLMEASKG